MITEIVVVVVGTYGVTRWQVSLLRSVTVFTYDRQAYLAGFGTAPHESPLAGGNVRLHVHLGGRLPLALTGWDEDGMNCECRQHA
jgi:hypothetical protein